MIRQFLNNVRNIKLVIREREMRIPRPPGMRFNAPALHLKLPALEGLRVPGSMAKLVVGVVGLSGLFIAGAMYFSIVGVVAAPNWPESGADYALGSPGGTVGERLPDEAIGTAEQAPSQTLQITLASGARISTLALEDLDLGKTGLTTCFQITRDSSNTTGYLYADAITMVGVSAPSFAAATSTTAVLTLAGQVDGHTNSATLDSTISDMTILSTRGAGDFRASDSKVDRVIINLLGDANVGTLSLDGVRCSVGAFDLAFIKAGLISIDPTSRFGTGSGINSADFVVNTTVKYRSQTDSLVDTPITVR